MRVKKLTTLGIALALIFILSALEQLIPPLPTMPPGVKLGLSNIVTMYCAFFIGKKEAAALAFLKAGFAFLTRGAVASVLSLCGGLLSILTVIILIIVFKDGVSYIFISVFGAIMHNAGQLLALAVMFGTLNVFYYFPLLLISGAIMGVVTGTLLKVVLPVLGERRER